jgi:hypothetical protein
MRTRNPELAAKIRRTIFDMARRRRPGSGSRSLQPDEVYRMEWPDLTNVLGDIPWAVAGGVATRRYMPERHTSDLDIVLMVEDQQRAESLLAAAGYAAKGPLAIEGVPGSTWDSPEGVPVDLITLPDGWAETALEEAATNLGSDGMPVLPLAFLVILKMDAIRPQDTADVERMLAAASPEMRDHVRSVVRRWEPRLIGDLESTIAMAKLLANEE